MNHLSMQNFFCTNLSPNKNSPINLLQIGWDKCSPGYTYSNFRDMYIIHYTKSGYGVFETNGQRYNIQPNDAYIVRPNTLAIQTADLENPWEIYYFAFNGELAGYFLEKTLFKDNTVSVTTLGNTIWQFIIDIIIELNNNPVLEFHYLEYLFKLLSYFEAKDITAPAAMDEFSLNDKFIYTVKKYISMNFSRTIKISDIANQLNINRSHLYRIFKEKTGRSLEEYLVTTRLNEARRLLDDTSFSVSAISNLVGYPNSSSFFKLFKSICEMRFIVIQTEVFIPES